MESSTQSIPEESKQGPRFKMAEISEEEIQMSERLTRPDGPEDDIRTRVRQPGETSCWQSFSNSLASFCGLVDEEQEARAKWQARLEDLQKDSVIGHGKKPDEDETDAAPHIRCSPRMPISLSSTSKRCRRITLREAKQAGLFSTAIDGFKDLMAKPKKSLRKPTMRSRSFTPAAIREFGQPQPYSDYRDEVDVGQFKSKDGAGMTSPMTLNDNFFSEPVGTSVIYRRKSRMQPDGAGGEQRAQFSVDEDEVDFGRAQRNWEERGNWRIQGRYGEARRIPPEALGFEAGFGDDEADIQRQEEQRRRDRQRDRERIGQLGDNTNRQKVNQGWFGKLVDQGLLARCFKFKLTDEARIHKHRPLFSIWMTFVQVLIFIVSISVYGIAPWGYDQSIVSKEIIQPNLALKLESYVEKDNLWVGPRQKDLITLGAKFSPCMRRDTNVFTAIGNDRVEENKTACCVYNDGSGCVQTREEDCSDTLAMWHKWSKKNPGGPEKTRVSGSVCGQDPKTCRKPASLSPFVWADDITKWPICDESINSSNTKENRHLNCEVVGRPCCMRTQGECLITTRDHCDFYRGHFHEEATLCSQVNCMADICGMLPFGNPQVPDQFYRLWTCLFLHAGLIHLLITVLFNVFVMVSIEQTIGWIRVVVIYMGSGVCGSLASAIFVPYHVEAGASGSQFGLLATQLVLVILFTDEPLKPSLKIMGLLLGLLVIGLLPMVDNYAHLFGFVFGLLLSFAILPFTRIKMGQMTVKQQRIIAMVVCSILATGLAALLIILFYVAPLYNCPGCQYFNCIPFTPTFCDTMEVKIRGVSTA